MFYIKHGTKVFEKAKKKYFFKKNKNIDLY